MLTYVVRRLLFLLPLWLGVSIIVFTLMRLMPGDVATAMLGQEGSASQAELESVRRNLGLDQPVPVQYLNWLGRLVRLDFGTSLYGKQPVLDVLASRLPPTLNLAVLALLLSIVIGVPTGVISAAKRGTPLDYSSQVISILGLALPPFWLAVLATLGLALIFHWSVPLEYAAPWQNPGLNLQKMILPAIILGYEQAAMVARLTRSAMLDVLAEDFVRTARAKGLSARRVLSQHALPNGLLPVVTVLGTNFALMLGGVVVLELVFSIPGVGSLLIESIRRRDYPVVEILLMMSATAVMLVNLLTEASYAWLDPRVSHG